MVRTGTGGELFWSRWAGWRGRVDRAGAAGAGSTQSKNDGASTQSEAPLEVALAAGRPRASGQVNRRGGLTLGWCARCLSSGLCGFFEFGELTSPTGSLNGDAFRRALGRVSQSRRSVTFPYKRCRLAEEWTRTVSSTIRYGPVLRRLYWEEQYLAGASNRLVKDSHSAAARRGGENY